jgi:Chaperone of endosialidase
MRTASCPRYLPSVAALAAALACSSVLPAQVLAPNLLYTSIQPCRIIDTRLAGGPLAVGVDHQFDVVGVAAAGSLDGQGGNPAGCPIPGFLALPPPTAQVQAVAVNLVAVGAAGAGNLVAWPSDQPQPATSVLNYAKASDLGFLNVANGVILPVRQDLQGGDLTVKAQVAGTHLVADIVGYFSNGSPTQAQQSLFLGPGAGNPAVTTGGYNTALGEIALGENTIGTVNTAVGWGALGFNAAGSSNTALGVEALIDNTSGSFNVAVGHYAGWALNTGDNNLYLANEGVGTESNTIRIGRVTPGTYNPSVHTATYIAGIDGATSSSGTAVYVASNGQLGTLTSSRRFKEDVRDMGEASAGLLSLRPVTFHYKPGYDDGTHLLQYGLIAEEVAEVFPDLVQRDAAGQPVAIRYHMLDSMLVNELQKQNAKIAEQSARLAEQDVAIARLAAKIEQLERHACAGR